MAEGLQQRLLGPGDEGGPVETAFRDLAEIDGPAGERLSRGVEQVVEDEDLLRQGNFALARRRGDGDLRPGDAPGLAEIGHDEALLAVLDKYAPVRFSRRLGLSFCNSATARAMAVL